MMTSPVIGPKPNLVQNIKSKGAETEFSAEIVAQTVYVHCKQGDHTIGSSKVKLTNRSDYNWEFRYNHGNLIAAHINGKIIAYALKVKESGMVRVANLEYNKRVNIKNLKDDIKDISFAYLRQEVILGVVDSEGNILIYKINEEPTTLTCELLLHIYHRESANRSKVNYRLIWCPYNACYADTDDDTCEDPEKIFVVLNGTKAEVVHITLMTEKYGIGPIDPNESYDGYIEISNDYEVVDACFSVDGTAIAIASTDGTVKFFQLYMVDSEKVKCLHEWRPHGDKPISSIIFIDNILEYSTECWEFTITGANHNSEIKLWSCESWTCLQTIHFNMEPTSSISNLYLNMSVDYTRQYLVISDINNRVMYVLQLKRNNKEHMVYVTTLSQFLLSNPFLSYHILEANTRALPYSYSNSSDDEDHDDFDEERDITTICLKMLVIQPKQFQECKIIFQPETLLMNTSSSLNDISDLEVIEKKAEVKSTSFGKSQLNLMTPEDFTAPAKGSRPNSVRNSLTNEVSLDESGVENLIDFQRPQKDVFASGGSSPSREVQEILSLNNSTYSPQDYFENLTKMKDEQVEQPQKEHIYEVGNELVWPKIPVVKDDELVKEVNDINELESTHLQTINFRIGALENCVREQSALLQKMHGEMKELVQGVKRCDKEEFIRELNCEMSKQQLQIAKIFENLLHMQKTSERELQEKIVSSVGQILSKTMSENLQMVISHEMKHVIVPAIRTLIDSYKHQTDGQYMQKLNNAEITLKDNLAKALSSQALAESLSVAVVSRVAPSLEKCYKDIIASSLIPSWERICGTMFQQINETFTKGTKEYTLSVESYMDRQRRVQEKGKDLIIQMQSVSENMKTNNDKLTNTLTTEIHKQFNNVFKSMQDKLSLTIRDVVADQVRQGFKSHAAVIEDSVMNAVRSRAVTPSPHVDTQVTINQIQQLLHRGSYNEAFQVALSAENLSMVIYVCERVNVSTLFEEEYVLQQSCVLALIQQLSMDLHQQTELKLSYIRAAFLALTSDCPNTKQFIPKVLKDLLKQLTAFMQTGPPVKQATDAKLLIMAVDSMIGNLSHKM